MQYIRIRNLREDNDWTQGQVGAFIGVSQRVYGYYESGEHTIPPDILSALADLYHVSVDYLLERTGAPLFTLKNAERQTPTFLQLDKTDYDYADLH